MIVDGVSNNSLIDPVLNRTFDYYDVPGNENSSFVDLDLIESIKVYDSNISAEYGGFLGGVIDVDTKRAGNTPKYKVSFKHTNDSLTKFHINKDFSESFKKAKTDSFQPKFKKNFFNMYIDTPINDSNGLIFTYSRKESIIPGAYFSSFRDKKRLNHNALIKLSHYFKDDSIMDITASYSPYESTHFISNVKDSDVKIKGGGYNAKINYEKNFNFWNLDTNLAYLFSENTKESANYTKEWIKTNSKPWGGAGGNGNVENSIEGGTGNIEKIQEGINYNLKLSSNEFKAFNIENKIKTGISLNFDSGTYNRKADTVSYFDPIAAYNIDCGSDTISCIQNEQYFTAKRYYKKEKLSENIFDTAAYIENRLKFKNLEITPGVRADYNNYLKNLDFAYRLNGSVKPFSDDKTIIYAGANRYYGKSFLAFKLREARLPFYEEIRHTKNNVPQNWESTADQDETLYRFSNLKTPYSDELAVGLKQDLGSFIINLKHTKRDSKNKFISEQKDSAVFERPDGRKSYYKPITFINGGTAENKTTSLTITPVNPVSFSWGNLRYKLSTSWSKSKSNSKNYDDILKDTLVTNVEIARYNNEYVKKDDLTIERNPRQYNLNLNMMFNPITLFGKKTKINLNNDLTYRLAYKTIEPANNENSYENTYPYVENFPDGSTRVYRVQKYEDTHFKDSFTYDLRLSIDFKLKKKNHLLFNTEINNVFNKVENIESQKNSYKMGRQFWFEVAYKF